MLGCSESEITRIDAELDPILAWAETRTAEAEQLALDATRLLSCAGDRLTQYEGAGFVKRCRYRLSGKHGEILRANQKDLVEVSKYALRYIDLLLERDLLRADSLITVKNNLETLAIREEETIREIRRMEDRINDRLSSLEQRTEKLEQTSEIQSWVITIKDEWHGYHLLPKYLRLLKVVRDFFDKKEGDWGYGEILCLRKALTQLELPPDEKITLADFVEGIIMGIEQFTFLEYEKVLTLRKPEKTTLPKFVIDNIAVDAYAALYTALDDYPIIISKFEKEKTKYPDKERAFRTLVGNHLKIHQYDLSGSMSASDLAIELLHCIKLTKYLPEKADFPEQIEKSNQEQSITDNNSLTIKKGPVNDTYKMAEKYYHGKGVKQNSNEALMLYHQAAEQGSTEARYQLANMYYDLKEIDKHYKKAFKWYSEAAKQGYADAQYKLGCMYRKGEGIEKSYQEAVKWYEKAADQKHIPSLMELGDMYAVGDWVTKNSEKMFECYKQAADEGGELAQCLVAYCFFCGDEIAQDFAKAEEYLLKCVSGKKMTKEEIIKRFVSLVANTLNSRFYCGGKIPDRKRLNALKTFLGHFSDDEILLYYDDTIFGGGDDGFAIGLKGIAWQAHYEFHQFKPFSWVELNHASIKGGAIVFRNGAKIKMGCLIATPMMGKILNLLKIIYKISLA